MEDVDGGDDFFPRLIKGLNGVDPELRQRVLEEMLETQREGSNIILVGTDAKRTVTIMHVDKAALNGADGPVLFPTADERFVLAAVSTEMLEKEINVAESMADENLGDMYWDGFMSDLMDRITKEAEENPQVLRYGGE